MPPQKIEPGRDAEMAERTDKLNALFALSSVGLLIVLSLMVWKDYDREWKKHQLRFNRMEVQLTEAEIAEALGQVDAARRAEVDALVARGEQEAAAQRQAIREARTEIDRVHGEWYAVDQEYRFTKADLDVTRYEYDEASHKGSSAAPTRLEELRALERKLDELRLQLEEVSARETAARARLDELQKTRLEAERGMNELYAEQGRLQEQLDKIRESWVFQVRNLPVLDMLNPSLKVNQIMPANLYDDVNFTLTEKVDRCTTCHLGIDKAGYEEAEQPFKRHPNLELYLRGPHPIEKIGCTVCHQGRGRATGFQTAAHLPTDKEQERAWGGYTGTEEYEPLHHWDLPMLARGHTESQCRKCHQGVLEVPGAERLNTGLLLIERYGCYGCHKIKGWEGLRKAGPDLTKIASKTSEDWILRWLEEPKAFRITRMPQFWNVRIDESPELAARNGAEIAAVTAYILDKSSGADLPEPPRGDLARGRELVESVGCLGCHRIGDDQRGVEGLEAASFRAHGPNLAGTGSKVDAGWLFAWLRNPSEYWHETRMPRLRLTTQEAADITAYLMTLTEDGFAARPAPQLDPKARDAVVMEYLLAQNTVQQSEQMLAAMDERQRTLFLGEKTIARYGCFGCHMIRGFETASPIGVELTEQGSKLAERLDFGFEEETIPHTLPAWLHRKLMEPRVFDRDKEKRPEDLLRMPKFFFDTREADAIVTAILSLTKERVPLTAQKQLDPAEQAVARGERMVRDYNCRGCHQIGEKGGTIRALVEDGLKRAGGDTLQAQALSPPLLFAPKSKIGEGARAHTPWLHDFLRDPSEPIRPWLELRMPSFDLSETETNTLTTYFASLDRVPFPYAPQPEVTTQMVAAGRELFEKWQCVKCHVVAGKLPNQDPANMAPDLAKVPERLRPDWLSAWLADPQSIMPGTRMPANFPKDPAENAFPEILEGDQQQQIEAVRAYLLTLGGRGRASAD